MTIPVNTLCLLVRDHGLAGRTCTVTEVVRDVELLHRDGRWEWAAYAYAIDVPGEPVARDGMRVAALHRHLVPLAPPTPIESTEREVETC